jgi:hypothetical protein
VGLFFLAAIALTEPRLPRQQRPASLKANRCSTDFNLTGEARKIAMDKQRIAFAEWRERAVARVDDLAGDLALLKAAHLLLAETPSPSLH